METLTEHIWTDEVMIALPKEHGKYELIDGELTLMSPAGFDHDKIAMNIGSALHQFVRQHKLGSVVSSSAGFRLDHENVLSPDTGYISRERERLAQTPAGAFFEACQT